MMIRQPTTPRLLGLMISVLLTGCLGTHVRPMNRGEKTVVSDDVEALLAVSDGAIDTRDFPDIRCRRYKTVGTHMITRYCYFKQEEEDSSQMNRDGMLDTWGRVPCVSRTSIACQAGLEGPRSPAGPR